MTLIVSRGPAADIERLRAFLADKDVAAAQRAVAVPVGAVQSLETLPERGRPAGTPFKPGDGAWLCDV